MSPTDLRPFPLFFVQAHALFGFGGDKETQYAELTAGVIAQVRFTLDLPATSDEKAAAIEKTRKLTNDWVARYRRDQGITGRPSSGHVYSALNAASGHYNNFARSARIACSRSLRLPRSPFPAAAKQSRNLVGGCRVVRCSYRCV